MKTARVLVVVILVGLMGGTVGASGPEVDYQCTLNGTAGIETVYKVDTTSAVVVFSSGETYLYKNWGASGYSLPYFYISTKGLSEAYEQYQHCMIFDPEADFEIGGEPTPRCAKEPEGWLKYQALKNSIDQLVAKRVDITTEGEETPTVVLKSFRAVRPHRFTLPIEERKQGGFLGKTTTSLVGTFGIGNEKDMYAIDTRTEVPCQILKTLPEPIEHMVKKAVE